MIKFKVPCQEARMTICDSQTDEQDVIEQDIVMDAESLEVSGDKGGTGEVDGSEQGVRQMEEDEDVTIDERRRRVTSNQPARQSSPEDETSMASSTRQRREATIAAIKEEILNTVSEERPDLEQVNYVHASIRTTRSKESIQASRMLEINNWKERGVIERWSWAEAVASGGKIFQARWVDDPFKEKSRYVVKDFATTRGSDGVRCSQ